MQRTFLDENELILFHDDTAMKATESKGRNGGLLFSTSKFSRRYYLSVTYITMSLVAIVTLQTKNFLKGSIHEAGGNSGRTSHCCWLVIILMKLMKTYASAEVKQK